MDEPVELEGSPDGGVMERMNAIADASMQSVDINDIEKKRSDDIPGLFERRKEIRRDAKIIVLALSDIVPFRRRGRGGWRDMRPPLSVPGLAIVGTGALRGILRLPLRHIQEIGTEPLPEMPGDFLLALFFRPANLRCSIRIFRGLDAEDGRVCVYL